MPILEVEHIHKSFGKIEVLKDISFSLEKGQVVSKGELLVSAVVKTRKENELLTGAKGNVFARTQRHFEIHVPVFRYEKQYTENEYTDYSFRVAGFEFGLPNFRKKNKSGTFECEKNTVRPIFFGKIELPFEIVKRTFREYESVKLGIEEDECKKTAEAKLVSLVEKKLGSAPVISKKVDFKVNGNIAVLVCDIECIENIAYKVPITFSV